MDKATGQTLKTYTVITTDPNELHRQDYVRWLAPADPAELPVDLLKPFPAEEMKAWPVSQDAGNVRNNRPELVEPIQSV